MADTEKDPAVVVPKGPGPDYGPPYTPPEPDDGLTLGDWLGALGAVAACVVVAVLVPAWAPVALVSAAAVLVGCVVANIAKKSIGRVYADVREFCHWCSQVVAKLVKGEVGDAFKLLAELPLAGLLWLALLALLLWRLLRPKKKEKGNG